MTFDEIKHKVTPVEGTALNRITGGKGNGAKPGIIIEVPIPYIIIEVPIP